MLKYYNQITSGFWAKRSNDAFSQHKSQNKEHTRENPGQTIWQAFYFTFFKAHKSYEALWDTMCCKENEHFNKFDNQTF